jgi:two-component system CheB/CheR fusion protein
VCCCPGSGSDGMQGLKRLKELGGVAIAQTPQDAEFDAMPRNAIASGRVDISLPVAARNGIKLHDGAGLLAVIGQRTP